MMTVGDVTFVREQFTGWDESNHPYIHGDEYLEYEKRSTHLSKDVIITFGFKKKIEKGPGWHEYEWVKKSQVPSQFLVNG